MKTIAFELVNVPENDGIWQWEWYTESDNQMTGWVMLGRITFRKTTGIYGVGLKKVGERWGNVAWL